MNERIKLIHPYITFDELSEELESIFISGQLTKGKHVENFANKLKAYCQSEYAFLATSATTALWMCLKALRIKPGDKVAISDFSFPATANIVEDLGAIPIFIDVSKDTFNMLPENLEARMNDGIKAVIFVDALGNPSGLLDIKNICEKFNVPLIEDAACAIGSSINKKKIGSIADLTCFSFHPRKLLTTGEGGAILTNNPDYADWLQVKLNHGASGFSGKGLNFVDYGYNFRMNEIQALMGWKQLEKLDQIVHERNEIASLYSRELEGIGFTHQKIEKEVIHNTQSVVFRVPPNTVRDELIDYLDANNIESTIGTYCLSATNYYKNEYNDIQPNAYYLEENTITLPCFKNINIERVISVLRSYYK